MAGYVCPWWGGFFIDNRLRRLLHKPEKILAPYLEPGMTAIDFGCGMGVFSIAMARMVGDAGRVIAVDVQEKMLEVLGKRAEKAGVAQRIRTHRCPPDSIGVDDQVDFVLAFWSAHETPDVARLLGRLHGSLAGGGRLLLAEPKGHVRARRFEKMIAAAERAGLRLESRPPIRLSWAAAFKKP